MVDGAAYVSGDAEAGSAIDLSIRKLREHGIIPNRDLQSFVCVKEGCKCEIPLKKKVFSQHLKKPVHNGLGSEVIGELWECGKKCSDLFEGSDNGKLGKYRSGGWSVGVLPTIVGLPVVKARKCPKCDKIFEAENALRNHFKIAHGETLSRGAIRKLDVVLCQSLARQTKGKKLYRCDAADICGEGDDRSEGTGVREGGIAARLKMFDHGKLVDEPTSSAGEACDRQRGSFSSMAKCLERLRMWSLTVVEGWHLWKYPSEDEERLFELAPKLNVLLKEYAIEAYLAFKEAGSFYSTLWDIGTPGVGEKTRRFKFLDRDRQGCETLDRYSRSVRCVLLVACRVFLDRERYKDIELGGRLAAALEGLLGEDADDKIAMLEKMHRVLYSVFFEKSSLGEGSKKLFASVIGACLCVGGSSAERVYIRRGKEVSPYISGILYFVSCCGLLQIRRYCPYEVPETAEEEVTHAMMPGRKAGLTVFVELRTICATVRMEENALHLFVRCDVHEGCGFFEGIEFSIDMLGEAVRKVQRSVRSTLMDGILFGRPLLSDFREKCNTIYDDASCVTPGYSALSDTRNRELVSACMKWSLENVANVHLCTVEAERAWSLKVEQLLPELLTLVHLVGGAPGRGTELGSIGLRNSQERQRGVYFAGWEVMIVPTYSKTRSMRRGEMRFISRHMDRETSFLLKCFFLLVHPLYVTTKMLEIGAREANRSIASYMKEKKLRDDLCGLVVAPQNVARDIGNCFSRFGIPFSFTSYRHWQRGYIKMVEGHKLMKRIEEEMEGSFDNRDEEEGEVGSIVQAGHSMHVARMVYAQGARYGYLNINAEKDKVEKYRRASREWHVDLGIGNVEEGSRRGRCVSLTSEGGEGRLFSISEADVERIARSVASEITEISSGRISESKRRSMNSGDTENVGEMQPVEENEEEEIGNGGLWRAPETVDVLVALRAVLRKPTAEFKSYDQKMAMEAVAERSGNVAIILATGVGKTAVVMGPILFEKGCTLWISPLRALLGETRERLMQAGITERTLDSIGSSMEKSGNVILLGPEDIDDENVLRKLTRLAEEGLLVRIVFDEAHIPYQARKYRGSMGSLKALGVMKGVEQRVLLTATAPSSILKHVAETCGVDASGVRVIRGDPCRGNLRINVAKLCSGEVEDMVKHICGRIRTMVIRTEGGCRSGIGFRMEESRYLVYCLAIADLEEYTEEIRRNPNCVGSKVSVLKYHSGMPREEREESARIWRQGREGRAVVMFATEGFFTGTDYAHVRGVVFAGGCRSIVEFWQAAGRAGRDGKCADISVVYSPSLCQRFRDDIEDNKCLGDFEYWVENLAEECRRKMIEDFLGGSEKGERCRERGDVEYCDVCAFTDGAVPAPVKVLDTQRGQVRGALECRGEERIVESKRMKLVSRVGEEVREKKLRSWDRTLKKRCVFCVFEEAVAGRRRKGNESGGLGAVSSVRRCSVMWCPQGMKRCLRCTGTDHKVRDCTIIPSVQSSGPGRCRECFLNRVEGRLIHGSNEFGKRGLCPFSYVMKFVMMGFSDEMVQTHLKRMYREKTGRTEPMEFADYVDWVRTDNVDNRAAVFDIMEWLHGYLQLSRFGLESGKDKSKNAFAVL